MSPFDNPRAMEVDEQATLATSTSVLIISREDGLHMKSRRLMAVAEPEVARH